MYELSENFLEETKDYEKLTHNLFPAILNIFGGRGWGAVGRKGSGAAADPGGGQGGHGPPPVPVKTSHKKDGRHRRPLIFHVSWPPPL